MHRRVLREFTAFLGKVHSCSSCQTTHTPAKYVVCISIQQSLLICEMPR
uniref:Uncharacterized protein n=1 Tax=Arundo donax TaxID=35708 RepID=A0A0A9B893_ARUDO